MRKFGFVALILALSVLGACSYSTNLKKVADDTGMRNITTGDGTFENYVATGQYKAYRWGLAIGLPLPVAYLFGVPHPIKIMEIYPRRSNEDLVTKIAVMAKDDGAKAMINVTPHHNYYTGCLLGFYSDYAIGTGIAAK